MIRYPAGTSHRHFAAHPTEHQHMNREKGIPVYSSKEPQGSEGSFLDEVPLFDAELEPRFTGEPHFGVEDQSFVLFVGQDYAPEVEGIAGIEFVGVFSPPVKTRSAGQFINKPSDSPQPVAPVPTVIATNLPYPFQSSLFIA